MVTLSNSQNAFIRDSLFSKMEDWRTGVWFPAGEGSFFFATMLRLVSIGYGGETSRRQTDHSFHLTNFMEHTFYCESNCRSAGKEIICVLWTQVFMTLLIRSRHWTLFRARWHQSTPSHPNSAFATTHFADRQLQRSRTRRNISNNCVCRTAVRSVVACLRF